MIFKLLIANFYNFFENIVHIYKIRNKPHNVYTLNQSLLEQNLNYYIQKADEYFEQLIDSPYHLNKPLENLIETPELLWKFGLVLSALKLGVEQTILDFGCGTYWTSDFLKRMDLTVYALDVSKNAEDIL